MKNYRTSAVAKIIGVHPNTVLLYEKWGYISTVPRSDNGYRVYSENELILLKIIKLLRGENYITQCVRNMIKNIQANDFEFLNKEDELLSPIEEKEKDIKNLISHLSTLIDK
jgi:DNA-binding transcriptional MerR regulator